MLQKYERNNVVRSTYCQYYVRMFPQKEAPTAGLCKLIVLELKQNGKNRANVCHVQQNNCRKRFYVRYYNITGVTLLQCIGERKNSETFSLFFPRHDTHTRSENEYRLEAHETKSGR